MFMRVGHSEIGDVDQMYAVRRSVYSFPYPPEPDRVDQFAQCVLVHFEDGSHGEAVCTQALHRCSCHLVLRLTGQHQRHQHLIAHHLRNRDRQRDGLCCCCCFSLFFFLLLIHHLYGCWWLMEPVQVLLWYQGRYTKIATCYTTCGTPS